MQWHNMHKKRQQFAGCERVILLQEAAEDLCDGTWTTTMSTSDSSTFQPSSRNSRMILNLSAEIAWLSPVPACALSTCPASSQGWARASCSRRVLSRSATAETGAEKALDPACTPT